MNLKSLPNAEFVNLSRDYCAIIMETKTKKETYYRCKKCGDEIHWNTHKQMTYCKCGALGVDGCEFYVRFIGDEADREEVMKYRKL